MTDAHGRPEQTEDTDPRTPTAAQQTEDTEQWTTTAAQQTEDTEQRTTTAAQQTVSLNTQQAAQQLAVDSRTIRRYITEGIRTAGGGIVRLEARQVRSNRGPEWQIYQTDLEAFKRERDRAATEGQAAGQLIRPAEESQALITSVQIIATELERRSLALSQAQETIERLAREAGRQAGRNEELERERDALQRRVKELEEERDQWRQKAEAPKAQTPRRIRLLSWRKEAES